MIYSEAKWMSSSIGCLKVQGKEAGTREGLMSCPHVEDRKGKNREKEHEGRAQPYLQKVVPCPTHLPLKPPSNIPHVISIPYMAFVNKVKPLGCSCENTEVLIFLT